MVDNSPHLLECGTYYFDAYNFILQRKSPGNTFKDCNDNLITCGSIIRIMPDSNTFAVY